MLLSNSKVVEQVRLTSFSYKSVVLKSLLQLVDPRALKLEKQIMKMLANKEGHNLPNTKIDTSYQTIELYNEPITIEGPAEISIKTKPNCYAIVNRTLITELEFQ